MPTSNQYPSLAATTGASDSLKTMYNDINQVSAAAKSDLGQLAMRLRVLQALHEKIQPQMQAQRDGKKLSTKNLELLKKDLENFSQILLAAQQLYEKLKPTADDLSETFKNYHQREIKQGDILVKSITEPKDPFDLTQGVNAMDAAKAMNKTAISSPHNEQIMADGLMADAKKAGEDAKPIVQTIQMLNRFDRLGQYQRDVDYWQSLHQEAPTVGRRPRAHSASGRLEGHPSIPTPAVNATPQPDGLEQRLLKQLKTILNNESVFDVNFSVYTLRRKQGERMASLEEVQQELRGKAWRRLPLALFNLFTGRLDGLGQLQSPGTQRLLREENGREQMVRQTADMLVGRLTESENARTLLQIQHQLPNSRSKILLTNLLFPKRARANENISQEAYRTQVEELVTHLEQQQLLATRNQSVFGSFISSMGRLVERAMIFMNLTSGPENSRLRAQMQTENAAMDRTLVALTNTAKGACKDSEYLLDEKRESTVEQLRSHVEIVNGVLEQLTPTVTAVQERSREPDVAQAKLLKHYANLKEISQKLADKANELEAKQQKPAPRVTPSNKDEIKEQPQFIARHRPGKTP